MKSPPQEPTVQWIVECADLWNAQFLSPTDLAADAQKYAIPLSARNIEDLWRLKLLKADIVTSNGPVRLKGLSLLAKSDKRYHYADFRVAAPRKRGWLNAARHLRAGPRGLELRFHPFRFLVLVVLHRLLNPTISPYQGLVSSKGFSQIAKSHLSLLKRIDLSAATERSNKIAEMAIAGEPWTYPRVFSRKNIPLTPTPLDHERRLATYTSKTIELCRSVSIDWIEQARTDICQEADRLDSNRTTYTMLRLGRGLLQPETRDRLGGSVFLRGIAETLRRMAEEAHQTELPEEDEKGFGHTFVDVRKRIYGSKRLFDGDRAPAQEFMRQQRIDFGTRLRWYVEGDTEYGALSSVFNKWNRSPITLVNLRGKVVERNILAFRDALRNDVSSGVFSFVSLDGDRSDFARAARKAAANDEICGRLLINSPDFEFSNFDISELEEIAWCAAIPEGLPNSYRHTLHTRLKNVNNAATFVHAVSRGLPTHSPLQKGIRWGEMLIQYAAEHPQRIDKSRRAIVEAVAEATRTASANYAASRAELKMDPVTGRMVKR